MAEQLTLEEMDEETEKAKEELFQLNSTSELTTTDIALWWKRWYLKCGHKRLGRILLKFAIEED